jgi:hypothetical protein
LVRELAAGPLTFRRYVTASLPLRVCAESMAFRHGMAGLALKVQTSLAPQRALTPYLEDARIAMDNNTA